MGFYREDYESGSSSRSNVIWMGTNIAEDENINNIEGNGEMYDILHDVYDPEIHTKESNLGNITSSPTIEEVKINGLLSLLSEAKQMLCPGARLLITL